MFLLKKIVAPLLFPLSVTLLLLAAGLLLLWLTRRQKTGKALVTCGFALLVMTSYGWVSMPLLRSLEHIHPPPAAAQVAGAKWVVVLGGGTFSDAALPMTARANAPTLARLIEGIRLHRQAPGSRLVLSGASVFGTGSDAESMSAIAAALGVSPSSIVTDDASVDTESQAENIARIVNGEPCLLVTSASHMPRAAALFRKAGVAVLPAPAQYVAQVNIGLSPADFYPEVRNLFASQIVESEYLGMAWSRLRGRI